MATVQLSQRPFLVFAVVVILHIILISWQVNAPTGIPYFQVFTFGAFSEVQRATMNTFTSVRNMWTGYVDLRSVQEENESLKRELAAVQIRLQEERASAQRTESLRQLLELRQRAGVATQAAEIIAGPAVADFLSVTIDKGLLDGLKRDMAVISPTGVVGRIVLPSARASQVQLLGDRNGAAGALIERTRAHGVVMGQGGDTLVMEYVPGTADVKQGDLVVTSGIDGIYPKGFVIGTVDVVDRGPGTFHKITVRPAVDFSRLEDVLVVTTPPPSITAVDATAPPEPATVQPPAPGASPPPARPAAANQSPRQGTATAPVPGAATNQSPRQGSVNQSPRRPAGNRSPAQPPPANQSPRQPVAADLDRFDVAQGEAE